MQHDYLESLTDVILQLCEKVLPGQYRGIQQMEGVLQVAVRVVVSDNVVVVHCCVCGC